MRLDTLYEFACYLFLALKETTRMPKNTKYVIRQCLFRVLRDAVPRRVRAPPMRLVQQRRGLRFVACKTAPDAVPRSVRFRLLQFY